MSSKNNPENRGKAVEALKYDGKIVKPVLYINGNRRYMAAQFENGDLVIDPIDQQPIPYKKIA
jgi:hypothetical protein